MNQQSIEAQDARRLALQYQPAQNIGPNYHESMPTPSPAFKISNDFKPAFNPINKNIINPYKKNKTSSITPTFDPSNISFLPDCFKNIKTCDAPLPDIKFDKTNISNNMYLSNTKTSAKRLQNLEDAFNSAAFPEKSAIVSTVPEDQATAESKSLSNVINAIFLPTNTFCNSNVENVTINNINNDKSTVFDAINNHYMSRCPKNSITEPASFTQSHNSNKKSFKEEMIDFVSTFKSNHEFKDLGESLIVLNSYLLSQIIDKVDEIDKQLKK